MPAHWSALRGRASSGVDRERDERRGGGDRRHDAHGADSQPAVERAQADHARDARAGCGKELDHTGERITRGQHPERNPDQSDRLRDGEDDEHLELS